MISLCRRIHHLVRLLFIGCLVWISLLLVCVSIVVRSPVNLSIFRIVMIVAFSFVLDYDCMMMVIEVIVLGAVYEIAATLSPIVLLSPRIVGCLNWLRLILNLLWVSKVHRVSLACAVVVLRLAIVPLVFCLPFVGGGWSTPGP